MGPETQVERLAHVQQSQERTNQHKRCSSGICEELPELFFLLDNGCWPHGETKYIIYSRYHALDILKIGQFYYRRNGFLMGFTKFSFGEL